ncbi:unnamed protein product [Didymodactylos carnosus]|uniref:CCHC-type domain-containing protein n=1 Tax=Didymodactylos carnosus TaxID=1234261 RepID=A0A814P6S7_9BILA|nr:unnamed protein product [Didymodactylos carnosus]CAF3866906.1 unnamed protein product [Didymodactylos carnosus]
MHGTKSEYTRHVKIEMLNRREYESLLNSGKVNLMDDSYEVNEFLPAPKVLICGRCNRPGHTKKYCQSSAFDICRRCGGDRTNIQAHKSCIVKCHHCGGEHEATSYKCPLISDFRRELIKQLKNHPERLPPQVQLFIPSDYRNKKDGARTIFSSRQYDSGPYQKSVNQNYYDRNDSQARPSVAPAITTDTTSASIQSELNEKIKSLAKRLEDVEKSHAAEKEIINLKYKSHIAAINQAWLLMEQGYEIQRKMISKTNVAVSEIMFDTGLLVTEDIYTTVKNIKTALGSTEFDQTIQ